MTSTYPSVKTSTWQNDSKDESLFIYLFIYLDSNQNDITQ